MFLAGGQGALRFSSVVSSKERIGHVERLTLAPWGVIVSADVGSRLVQLRSRTLAIAWATVFASLAAIAILAWTSRRLTKPLFDIRTALRARAPLPEATLPVPPQSRSIAEFDELVRAFDDLAVRLSASERNLVQAEKTLLLGRLAAGLAHEIGTPLNVISGRAESLMRHLGGNDPAVRSLRDISTQTERIVHIMSDMLDFARMKPPRRVPTSLEEVARTVLDMAKPQLARGHVAVRIALPPDLPLVVADADQLRQVCLNLVLNALDAMQEGGTLTIRAAVHGGPHADRGGPERRWVAVDFVDTGVGIPAANLDRLFDPFFTTKEPGKGTGLGLSVSYGIVEEHGGWFDVDSRPGEGTRMTVHLPIEGDTAPGREERA
jgi:signal transduction histidine kinase